jgi:hypothetical protein
MSYPIQAVEIDWETYKALAAAIGPQTIFIESPNELDARHGILLFAHHHTGPVGLCFLTHPPSLGAKQLPSLKILKETN